MLPEEIAAHKQSWLSGYYCSMSAHSNKVLGLITGWGRVFLCRVCMAFLWVLRFPPPLGLSPVSTLDFVVLAKNLELVPGHCAVADPLLLREWVKSRDQISWYPVYVTNKAPKKNTKS